jgi:hypothetical protein
MKLMTHISDMFMFLERYSSNVHNATSIKAHKQLCDLRSDGKMKIIQCLLVCMKIYENIDVDVDVISLNFLEISRISIQ